MNRRPSLRAIRPAAPAPTRFAVAAFAAFAALSAPATAAAEHHLFHPTPDSLMRDLSADRPDVTESPYTVDAGHAQVEMDLVRYARDRDRGERIESWAAPALNVKLGLDRSTDLQLLLECWRHDRLTIAGPSAGRVEERGFGDLGFRLKRNLWGNDAGRTAFAVMPFVLLPRGPAGEPRAVEFGATFPLGVDLGAGWGMGFMGEVTLIEDGDGHGRHAEWLATATTGRAIAGPLAAFVEFAVSVRPAAEGRTVATADAGFTFAVSPDLQLDAGIYFGANDAADDHTLFLGLTARR